MFSSLRAVQAGPLSGRSHAMVGIRPLFLAILMLAVIPASAAANSDTRIIVKRDAGLSAAERRDIRADAGVRYVESLSLPRTEVVAAAPGDVGDAVRDLNADPDVVYAQPARARARDGRPGALPAVGAQEHRPEHPVLRSGTDDADMDVTEAWELSTGAGQTVAVVDTGIDRGAPRSRGPGLRRLRLPRRRQRPEPTRTATARTWRARSPRRATTIGVAGVAPDSMLVPLRALGPGATDIETAEAFDWAGDHGVRIVNASLVRRAVVDRPSTTRSPSIRRRSTWSPPATTATTSTALDVGVSRAPTTSPT